MSATPETWLSSVRADGAAMASAARLGMEADVPSCPGWTVETLLNHTGRVHRWAAATLATKQAAPFPPRPDEVTPEWLDEGVAELCGTLQATPPDAEVWNHLGAAPRAIFWYRRMANETAVHRWDAESAHAVTTPIDSEVARGGIEEVFEVFLPRALAEKTDASLGGTLHLHATDGNGEWLVRVEGGGATVTQEHEKADLAIRGAASDLLLLLWGRLDLAGSAFETLGDLAVFDAWRDLSVAP